MWLGAIGEMLWHKKKDVAVYRCIPAAIHSRL